MACLYDMSELGIPLREVQLDGSVANKVGEKSLGENGFPNIVVSVFGEPDVPHKRNFYLLRVCKRCRSDWMRAISDWFLDKPVVEDDDDSGGVFVRDLGHTRKAADAEVSRLINARAVGEN